MRSRSIKPSTFRTIGFGIAIGTAAIGAYTRVFRPWYLRWGATEQEEKRVMPGDDLVPNPLMTETHAITINAPVETVWDWVIQIGQTRGGLYSYEELGNLIGSDGRSADRILPEFQNVHVGQPIALYPNEPHFVIAAADPPRFLILHSEDPKTGEFPAGEELPTVNGTWVFMLEPRLDNTTRLIVRARFQYESTLASRAWRGMIEPLVFLMERKTLFGIKQRAESHRVPDELLDREMPEYEFRGVESIKINATPAQIFQALKEVTLSEMPLAEILGELRYLPGHLAGKTRETIPPEQPFMEGVMTNNVTLAEVPDHELIIGCIAKFHQLRDQEFVPLGGETEFHRFFHADYQKLAMSFRVTGSDPAAGCKLTLEHRTHAMSEHARRQFALYWLAIKPGGRFVSQQLLHAIKCHAEATAKKAFPDKEKVSLGQLPAVQPQRERAV